MQEAYARILQAHETTAIESPKAFFSTRALYNFTGEHINSFSATTPALNEYVYNRRTTNVGFVYQVRPAVSLTLDINNIFNEPYRVYIGRADRMGTTIVNFVTMTVGVSGRF